MMLYSARMDMMRQKIKAELSKELHNETMTNDSGIREEIRKLPKELRKGLRNKESREDHQTATVLKNTQENATTVSCGRNPKYDNTAVFRKSCEECPQKPTRHEGCGGDCILTKKRECVAKPAAYTAFDGLSETAVTHLHEILIAVTKTFEEHNVKYWADSGTLLGALRNHPPGILRWDKDIDFVQDGEENYLEQTCVNEWNGWKIKLAASDTVEFVGKSPCLDIFGYQKLMCKEESTPMWRSYSTLGKECWFSKCTYTDKDLTETRDCKFWDLTIQCPVGAKSFLHRCYGPNAFDQVSVIPRNDNGILHEINLIGENLNDHEAHMPALDKSLVEKLLPNVNFDDFPPALNV